MLRIGRIGILEDTNAPKDDLKIGSRVKIKSMKVVKGVHLKGYDFNAGFVKGMMEYCGKFAKIVDSKPGRFSLETRYFLDIDHKFYKWTIAMFDWGNNLMETE